MGGRGMTVGKVCYALEWGQPWNKKGGGKTPRLQCFT